MFNETHKNRQQESNDQTRREQKKMCVYKDKKRAHTHTREAFKNG